MGLSLLSFIALGLVLYFGWALADPQTLKEVEDRVAQQSSAPVGDSMALRIRNGVGLFVGLVLLSFGLYRDLKPEAIAADPREAVAQRPLLPPVVPNQTLLDRIDDATLQKQIERQQAAARAAKSAE